MPPPAPEKDDQFPPLHSINSFGEVIFPAVIPPGPPRGACSLRPTAPASRIARGAPFPNRRSRGRRESGRPWSSGSRWASTMAWTGFRGGCSIGCSRSGPRPTVRGGEQPPAHPFRARGRAEAAPPAATTSASPPLSQWLACLRDSRYPAGGQTQNAEGCLRHDLRKLIGPNLQFPNERSVVAISDRDVATPVAKSPIMRAAERRGAHSARRRWPARRSQPARAEMTT